MNKPVVLVVEDNAVMQRVIGLFAKRFDVHARIVASGQEALEIFSHEPVDLVLMDWRLPDMDGLECTQHIREIESVTGRHTPVVAMTANVLAEHKQLCLDAGMDDYMSKPFSADDFSVMVSRWTAQARRASAS